MGLSPVTEHKPTRTPPPRRAPKRRPEDRAPDTTSTPSPGPSELPGFAVRQVATHILETIVARQQPLDRALELQAAWLNPLPARDRGFALTIVRAGLRRLRFLDTLIDRLVERPLPAEARRVRFILLVAAAQIVGLATPPHAAVNIAVEQCRNDRALRRFDKLVNAVARRLKPTADALAAEWQSPRDDIPAWLFDRWSETYGTELATRIAAASLEKAALDITVKSDAAHWASELGAVLLPTGTLRIADAGAIPDLPGYAADSWWVQDAAAALPARLLGDVTGKTVADLCAAPGGKTAQLAAAGANVTAVDVSQGRLRRLADNMARLKLDDRVTSIVADIENFTPQAPFDAVLLDAPCSATGTIRRHPDIMHLKAAADIPRLADLQARLLARAAAFVKPGGRLVYCTCSLEPEEGPRRIEAFLATHPSFERAPVDPSEFGGLSDLVTPDGDLRTLPCHLPNAEPTLSGLDGFYAARLRHKPA